MSRSVKVQLISAENGAETVVIHIDGKEVYRKAGDLSFLPRGVSHPMTLLAQVKRCLEGEGGAA